MEDSTELWSNKQDMWDVQKQAENMVMAAWAGSQTPFDRTKPLLARNEETKIEERNGRAEKTTKMATFKDYLPE